MSLLTRLSRANTFAALKHPNYRLWFIGMLISVIGSWMQSTAQGYLVYDLTGSSAYLGYVGFAAGIPTWLFTLYGGVIIDRVDRRKLILITQTVMMILAFVLAALVFTNVVQPWHIITLAFFLGITNSFDMPARQAFVSELVAREDITNAIALNSTLFNIALVVGPAVAGFTYALVGPAWCFAINGISYLGVIAALILMKLPKIERSPRQHRVWEDLKEGLRYIRSDEPTIVFLIGIVFIGVFAGAAITLIPAWAVDVLGGDVTTNGFLYSSRGIGAVIGGLMIASLGSRNLRGKIWTTGFFVLPVTMFIFSLIRNVPLALVVMSGVGWSFLACVNTANAMIQTRAPDELRGRVMSVYSLMFMGGNPIGSMLGGQLAAALGEPTTVAICAAAILVFSLAIFILKPKIRTVG